MPGNSAISSTSAIPPGGSPKSDSSEEEYEAPKTFTRSQPNQMGSSNYSTTRDLSQEMTDLTARLRQEGYRGTESLGTFLNDLARVRTIRVSVHDQDFRAAFQSASRGDPGSLWPLIFHCHRLSQAHAISPDSLIDQLMIQAAARTEDVSSNGPELDLSVPGFVRIANKRESIGWNEWWTATDNMKLYLLAAKKPTYTSGIAHGSPHTNTPAFALDNAALSLAFGASDHQRERVLDLVRAGCSNESMSLFRTANRNAAGDRPSNAAVIDSIFKATVAYEKKNGISANVNWEDLDEFIPKGQMPGYIAFVTQSEDYVAAPEDVFKSIGDRAAKTPRPVSIVNPTTESSSRSNEDLRGSLPSTKRQKTTAHGVAGSGSAVSSALPTTVSQRSSLIPNPGAISTYRAPFYPMPGMADFTTAAGQSIFSNQSPIDPHSDAHGARIPLVPTASHFSGQSTPEMSSDPSDFDDARRKYTKGGVGINSLPKYSSESRNTATDSPLAFSTLGTSIQSQQSVSNDGAVNVPREVPPVLDTSPHLSSDSSTNHDVLDSIPPNPESPSQ